MNVWKHCLLSQRKFGGLPDDYVPVHRFIDHSKLYLHHFRHRLLLHNLYGVELCMRRFGDFTTNSDGATVLVRDIAAAHCAEDLSGRVPTLGDWLRDSESKLARYFDPAVVDSLDGDVREFVLRPYLRSGLRCALLVTLSDFGVGLVEQFFGVDDAMRLRELIDADATVQKFTSAVGFGEKWKYTPDRKELQWLEENADELAREDRPAAE